MSASHVVYSKSCVVRSCQVRNGEKTALLPNGDWRVTERKLCWHLPKPSKQMAMSTKSIMTIGTSLGCNEQRRGLKMPFFGCPSS